MPKSLFDKKHVDVSEKYGKYNESVLNEERARALGELIEEILGESERGVAWAVEAEELVDVVEATDKKVVALLKNGALLDKLKKEIEAVRRKLAIEAEKEAAIAKTEKGKELLFVGKAIESLSASAKSEEWIDEALRLQTRVKKLSEDDYAELTIEKRFKAKKLFAEAEELSDVKQCFDKAVKLVSQTEQDIRWAKEADEFFSKLSMQQKSTLARYVIGFDEAFNKASNLWQEHLKQALEAKKQEIKDAQERRAAEQAKAEAERKEREAQRREAEKKAEQERCAAEQAKAEAERKKREEREEKEVQARLQERNDAAKKEKLAALRKKLKEKNKQSLLPGDIIEFGEYDLRTKYPQYREVCEKLYCGKEPLRWIVLDVDRKKERCLLISKTPVARWPYLDYSKKKKITNRENIKEVRWSESWIRSWLNDDFCNTVFADFERKLLVKGEHLSYYGSVEASEAESLPKKLQKQISKTESTRECVWLPGISDWTGKRTKWFFEKKPSKKVTAKTPCLLTCSFPLYMGFQKDEAGQCSLSKSRKGELAGRQYEFFSSSYESEFATYDFKTDWRIMRYKERTLGLYENACALYADENYKKEHWDVCKSEWAWMLRDVFNFGSVNDVRFLYAGNPPAPNEVSFGLLEGDTDQSQIRPMIELDFSNL